MKINQQSGGTHYHVKKEGLKKGLQQLRIMN